MTRSALSLPADLISVDDHLIEPATLWLDRAPDRYQELVPRVVERDGREWWLFDGRLSANLGLNAVAGKPREEWGKEPVRFSEMRPGCYDIAERVKDMDIDGVTAQLCFPSYGGFVGRTFLEASDKELALWCVQAYNDFVIDEWCAHAPGRQIPLTMVPMWDVGLAVQEAERCIAKGARAVSFCENLSHLGLPTWHTEHWDPFFAVVQEAGLPLCLHIGSSSHIPKPSPESSTASWIVLTPANAMSAATDLVFSRVLHEFPRLKFVFSEGGIGWVPYWLERCEWVFDRHHPWTDIRPDSRPRELFDRNIWVCCIEDHVGMSERDLIGTHKIMWECDYPHSDSLWPDSRTAVENMLVGVADDDVRRIMSENARHLFAFAPAV